MRKKEEAIPTSLRLPKSLLAQIDHYAESRDLSRTAAAISLFRKALATVDDPGEQPMTKRDYMELQRQLVSGLTTVTKAVKEQPVQIAAALPSPESVEAAKAEAVEHERERIRGLGILARIRGDS